MMLYVASLYEILSVISHLRFRDWMVNGIVTANGTLSTLFGWIIFDVPFGSCCPIKGLINTNIVPSQRILSTGEIQGCF